MELTHFNEQGRARMVDVSEKVQTYRVARAAATVRMAKATMDKIKEGSIGKGDVLAVAQVAGIMAAKKNSELIPMCHPLLLTKVDISFEIEETALHIRSEVRCHGETGVEMEALTAVSVAALSVDAVAVVRIYKICQNAQRAREMPAGGESAAGDTVGNDVPFFRIGADDAHCADCILLRSGPAVRGNAVIKHECMEPELIERLCNRNSFGVAADSAVASAGNDEHRRARFRPGQKERSNRRRYSFAVAPQINFIRHLKKLNGSGEVVP